MVKLIIRDDDCNFFTHPEDIEKVYRIIPDFPVSFAVVPTVTDVYGGCPETKGNKIPMPIGENQELVSYLKNRFDNKKCDILLHGITHGYKFKPDGNKIPEMAWREQEFDLSENIKKQKEYLEKVLGITINCFVAPSNRILKNGIKAIYENKMNYSGIIPLDFQREVNIRSIKNYLNRIWIRTTLGLPYPNVLTYNTHKELNACNTINYDYLKRMYGYCQKLDSPMAINVHYWHMRDFPDRYKGFFDFVKFALNNGAQPSLMRDCL